ncbi:DNA (cytosine-5-)-methyltransferase [Carnobacterium sp. PL17GRE32]|uniref:DNA (cytosine-5-)-methyltransferase n=1 Tax=Carnobacterium sp. PL17GRE32 TaxID=2592355 RepID=UPI0011EE3DFA|nr:DNA (cytosine-5-)-methyltransferase [Carnobacterium sp. PL17GRE32]KAF3305805.1 DNA (cytosine-5-)-methyltransferase [Carnobacterium sp. PL17GRE32]
MKIFSMFDGVGGFTIGFNNADSELFKTTYSNQYEPSKKSQDAYEVGVYRFPEIEHIPTDVALIPDEKFEEMKQNGVNMIAGGFPCQDYSVARSRKNELGIEGKKGVLFWEIIRATKIIQPEYLVLENVDRLLKAPTSQRGRDFAVMLASFNELGYSVEWRVINAAEYGRAQRRRRVFFFVYRNDTAFAKKMDEKYEKSLKGNLLDEKSFDTYAEYIFKDGLFARQFPIKDEPIKKRTMSNCLASDIKEVSDNYADGKFWNTGIMRHGFYYSADTEPLGNENPIPLKDIIISEDKVSEKYYIEGEKLEKFKYLRGPKRIERTSAEGHKYIYSEGGMSETDNLNLPGRTMLTSEGTINRSTHLLKIDGRYRLITPIEAERLQDFPDDWTKFKQLDSGEVVEVSERMRMFFMGNALVTGIVKRIGIQMKNIILDI